MDKNEYLDRFRDMASSSDEVKPRPSKAVVDLAQITADIANRITKDEVDRIIAIGATLYADAMEERRAPGTGNHGARKI